MAIYHLSTKPISRSGGRSATAAAAYRSAEKVHDLTTGEVFDYTRKGGVVHAEIVLPDRCAKQDINWARDRQQLWNAAEVAEKRKDARVAREYEVALPHELTKGQRVELVRSFAVEIANRYGVAVDFAIHKPHRAGDDRNTHAHLLATTRQVTVTGLGAKAAIEWSDTDRAKQGLGQAKTDLKDIRERWATLTNEALQERGLSARVDHRSLAAQGIEREPTTHLGVAVMGLERRGIETEVGKRVREQLQLQAQQRLEHAAELGRIERERLQVQMSLLDLSGDVQAAKQAATQAREQSLAKGPAAPEMTAEMTVAERLGLLSDQVAQRLEQEAEPERAARAEAARARAVDIEAPKSERELTREHSLGRSLGDEGSDAPHKERGLELDL